MLTVRKLVLGATVTAGLAAGSPASAQCSGPSCNSAKYPTLFSAFGSHNNGPAFQAAPWYLYWPYDAHFQTPAPVFSAGGGGAGYGYPGHAYPGQPQGNPYFPGAGWGMGGGYGPPAGYSGGYGYGPPAGYPGYAMGGFVPPAGPIAPPLPPAAPVAPTAPVAQGK